MLYWQDGDIFTALCEEIVKIMTARSNETAQRKRGTMEIYGVFEKMHKENRSILAVDA